MEPCKWIIELFLAACGHVSHGRGFGASLYGDNANFTGRESERNGSGFHVRELNTMDGISATFILEKIDMPFIRTQRGVPDLGRPFRCHYPISENKHAGEAARLGISKALCATVLAHSRPWSSSSKRQVACHRWSARARCFRLFLIRRDVQ